MERVGCAASQADPHATDVQAASGEFPITAVYSHEALGDGGAVCKIMERVALGTLKGTLDR